MAKYKVQPSGRERFFPENDIIVSKTDLKGHITYANRVFLEIASLGESEALGQPHCLIRHPDMPRCVFRLLWETIAAGSECFAYVKNMAVNGDHYWVLAHVTPTFGPGGEIIGYHSNRRVPRRDAVAKAEALYRTLIAEEQRHSDRAAGLAASYALLTRVLADQGVAYDEFVLGL